MSVPGHVRAGVNRVLRVAGVQIVRGHHDDPAISAFLPARKTLAQARRAGLSIEDYLDHYSAEQGATAATVDALLGLAELAAPTGRVCEIGPGSGRYLARVAQALKPEAYEIYETAPDWIQYLRERHPSVVVHPADGHTLAGTPSASVDLVHAHKLFSYIPFVTMLGYLYEMARVVRPGGIVAFDLITDDCLDERATKAWLSEPWRAAIYSVTPRQWTADLMAGLGLTLLGSHFVPLSGVRTELLVFRRG